MRIGFVLPHGWSFSGWSIGEVLERYHFSKHLAALVARHGHDVVLFVCHEELSEPRVLQEEPFRIEGFPITCKVPGLKFGGDVSLPLLRRLRRFEGDILHIHGCFDEAVPLFLLVASAPIVLQWHGGRPLPLHRTICRATFSRARKVVIPFERVPQSLRRLVPNSGKFEVVPLPLRPEAAASRPRDRYADRPGSLLYVGRIPTPRRNIWERRPDLLIEILGQPELVGITLDIVGDGPGKTACERIASQSGVLPRVSFHGFMELPRVMKLYRQTDLTVVPFAITDLTGTWVAQIQESLALGTPVIAFHPTGGFEEHEFGWRISSNPRTAAAQLRGILSRPDLLEAKGRRAAAVIRHACDEQRVSVSLETLYATLADAG